MGSRALTFAAMIALAGAACGDTPSAAGTEPAASDPQWAQIMVEAPPAATDLEALDGLWSRTFDLSFSCELRARFTQTTMKLAMKCADLPANGVEVPYERDSTKGTIRFPSAAEVFVSAKASCTAACCEDPVIRIKVEAGDHTVVLGSGKLTVEGISAVGSYRGCTGDAAFTDLLHADGLRKLGDR